MRSKFHTVRKTIKYGRDPAPSFGINPPFNIQLYGTSTTVQRGQGTVQVWPVIPEHSPEVSEFFHLLKIESVHQHLLLVSTRLLADLPFVVCSKTITVEIEIGLVTISDGETGHPVTFSVEDTVLSTLEWAVLSVAQTIFVRYRLEGDQLIATEIKRLN